MNAPFATIDLRPSSELMLALDAVVQSFNRLATAIEAQNEIGAVSVIEQTRASIETLNTQRGGGQAAAEMPLTPVKATAAVPEQPAKAPANAAVAPVDRATAERPPVSGNSSAKEPIWTPERCAILRRDYPAGVSTDTILERVNALPGKWVQRDRIAIKAHSLGFNRGGLLKPAAPTAPPAPAVDLSRLDTLGVVVERKVHAVAPAAPTSTPKPPVAAPQPKSRMEALAAVSRAIQEKPPADPGEPVFAGFEAVRRWAGERGLTFEAWDDLPVVNSKRERLGLPRFKREFGTKGVFG